MRAPVPSCDVSPLDPYRLPRHARPRRYDLVLTPDLAAARFEGEVTIHLDVDQATDSLVLNADELEILEATVDGSAARTELVPAVERLVVTPTKPLEPGSTVLHLRFRGTLNDKLRGFYRSTFVDQAGRERVIATTQMQATDCRRAFPCWDEPDFKAVFGVTLVVEPDLLAISNGPEVERTSAADGKVAVRFADTMPMSTYLVAFVVGPLEATAPLHVDGVALRVVHVPGKGHLTGFGLEAGAAALRWFVDYYGIPYPDAKIDLVALPDFAAGAMENVGCITFRENLLLIDPAVSTQLEQQAVVDVVAHELAHMWFGDLVTMRWWNGIWLNEAFATFMGVAACHEYRPDWQRWTSFALERSLALETDSLATTRPIEFEVRSPADADAMFDVLTYEKGGSLLRMLQQYLGEERFRDGVRRYLHTHQYGNTETSDLWDAIEATVGDEPVRSLMDSWIWQPGYPLVRARLEGDELVLDQRRFGFDEAIRNDPTTWLVPVHVRVGTDREHKCLLGSEPQRLRVGGTDRAVVVNAGGHGFYRVAYDDALLDRLTGSVLRDLSTVERYQLVDDAWNAVVADQFEAVAFLALAERFADEDDPDVWQTLATGLRGIGRLVDGETHEAFRARVRALVAPALARVGWTPAADEDPRRAKLRGLLVSASAVLGGDRDAQRRCRELLDAAEIDPTSVHPELVATATNVVAATGDARDYERFLAQFRRPASPQEQLRALYALAEFDAAELIQRTCDLAFSGEVKTQNAPYLLARCIANRHHGALAWRAVRDRWQEANQAFPANAIIRMVDPVKLLNTPELEADVQGFFAEHPIPQAAATLAQVLERQRVNVALRAREEPRLRAALTGSAA